MIKDKGILIKNIYYMLTYAFNILKQTNYDEMASEEFEKIEDLFAAILAKGISQQLKQGLCREYVAKCDNLSLLYGKIKTKGTIDHKLQKRQKLSCEQDELSENNIFNQILKTTATILLKQASVSKEYRIALKKVMLFFDNVDIIEPSSIKWSILKMRRNNQNYRMLLNICYFILDGLLLSTDKGEYKIANFLDDQHMQKLYEKFVLQYYKYHYPCYQVSASQVNWDIDDGVIDFLPVMQTDITIKNSEMTLIIDTKYYTPTMQEQYDKITMHSNHLYQIFSDVKNYDLSKNGDVSGVILYAKTDEEVTPDYEYMMSGNRINVKTLDLNSPFGEISRQLDKIIQLNFNESLIKK